MTRVAEKVVVSRPWTVRKYLVLPYFVLAGQKIANFWSTPGPNIALDQILPNAECHVRKPEIQFL